MIDAEKIDVSTHIEAHISAAAGVTPHIATYCSASDWALSANEHLHEEQTPLIYRRDDHWVALALGNHPELGPFLQPLEGEWGFSSPLLGPDPQSSLELLTDVLEHLKSFWQVAALSGLPPGQAKQIGQALSQKYRVLLREGIEYQVASLEGGFDKFLSRRSPRFRTNMRRDERRSHAQGIHYEALTGPVQHASFMERVLAIDRQTWKQAKSVSILASARHQSFYGAAVQRASERGGLRAVFAQQEGRDVAYVFGGLLQNQYRGFQLGYVQDVKQLGLGNQIQLALLRQLCASGVQSYDLGMAMAYKERWSDQTRSLCTLIVINPQRAAISPLAAT